MDQVEAKKHLTNMLRAVQRLRSIMAENGQITNEDVGFLHLTEEMAADVWKYIWGPACIIPALTKVLEAEQVEPIAFYNMMYIALVLEPLIGTAAGMQDPDFPSKMSIGWITDLSKPVTSG